MSFQLAPLLPVRLLPASATRDAAIVLIGRGMRAFCDGYVAILLPIHFALLGMTTRQTGILATSMLLGSACLTLSLGLWGHRISQRHLFLIAALLMAATGIGFIGAHGFWLVLAVAFFGTMNPTSGDVSLFLPLEQKLLAGAVAPAERTALFARYALVASLTGACGAMAAGLVDWATPMIGARHAVDTLFGLYAAVGIAIALLYRGLSRGDAAAVTTPRSGLGPSRRRVYGLAALFAVDSFGSGFTVNTIVALWLYHRFDLSIATTGSIFFATGLCTAVSYFAAPWLARRIGLINAMVFTHLPANALLVTAAFAPNLTVAFACLVLRALLSAMDVPARTSYVMAVVQPEERTAAASLTNVPRSLASSIGPALAAPLIGFGEIGWPLVIGGCLKIAYDLGLWAMFSRVKPPEEH